MGVQIRLSEVEGQDVVDMLDTHLRYTVEHSCPGSCHALDLSGLRAPDVTFWTARLGGLLVGCVALKEIEPGHGEIKSMHAVSTHRGQGIGVGLMTTLMDEARARGYRRISLETGASDGFTAARALYERFGFEVCRPFLDYEDDPESVFMTIELSRA